jgi:HEPN domain-containing protein
MNRADFHKLTEIRIKEAKILLDRKCYEGAYYLAGYAVECALEACIARKTQAYDFPPQDAKTFYTHDLDVLVSKADLKTLRELREQKVTNSN